MDADARWTRIRELFDAAVELPADRRAAFLARACGADLDLRREVDSLLEADDGATEVLPDGVAPDLVRQALGAGAPEELIGQRIGSYTIRAVLGAGGMGTVFEAEQDQPRRLVALKVMRAGRFSERVRRRFEYEAEILARRVIAKERRERYGSVGALAEDVRRFLADEPVLAGRPGRLYQLRKFVRRHRAGVAAAVTAVVAMVAGTVISVAAMFQAQAAEEAARRAQARTEKEKRHVAAVNEFLLDMIAEADPSRAGKAARVRDVLDRAAEKLAGFAPDDPELNLHLQATVTTSYFGLGEYRPALKLLDAAVPRARRELGPKHPLTLSLINNQGLCLRRLGRLEDAEPLLREALAGRREVLAPDDSYIADSLINLATLQEKRGEFADALALYREAYRIRVADKGENSQGALRTLSSMAIVHERMGDAEAALRCARQAYAPCVELFGRDHRTTQGTANNLASILRATGAHAEAAEIFRQLLESQHKRYEPHHPTVLRTMNNLATALEELGRRKEAIDLLRRQIERLREGAGNRVEALIAANNLAATLRDDGQLEEAGERFRAVLAESHVLGNPRHWLVGVFHKGDGECLLRLQRLQEAERELLLGVDILAEKFGDADQRAHNALVVLAEIYTQKGDEQRAAALAPRLAAHKGGQ